MTKLTVSHQVLLWDFCVSSNRLMYLINAPSFGFIACTLTGDILPPQLVYPEKTDCCVPCFSKNWSITCSQSIGPTIKQCESISQSNCSLHREEKGISRILLRIVNIATWRMRMTNQRRTDWRTKHQKCTHLIKSLHLFIYNKHDRKLNNNHELARAIGLFFAPRYCDGKIFVKTLLLI